MYEFVAEGCFENPTTSERFQRLQLDAIAVGRCGCPGRLSGSAYKISRGFINKDLDTRQWADNARAGHTCRERRAAGANEAQQGFNLTLGVAGRIVNADVFTCKSPTNCFGSEP